MTQTRTRFLLLSLVVLALAGLTAALAIAATPSSGSISKASPKVEWTGAVAESAITLNAWNNNPEFPCIPPSCDSFALTTADAPYELVLKAGATEQDATNALRVTAPDGTITHAQGDSTDSKPFILKIKNAQNGEYTVDYANFFVGGLAEYKASAEIGGTTAAPAPGGTPAPGVAPAPGASPTPVPAPGSSPARSDFTLSVKAPKSASSKKLKKKRKITVGVKVSRQVESVRVDVLKGKKVVAKGATGRVASSAAIRVALKKGLKPGAYIIRVTATDASKTSVTKSVKLKVKK